MWNLKVALLLSRALFEPKHILDYPERSSLDLIVHPAQVFAYDPQRDQLHAAQEEDRDTGRSPSLSRLDHRPGRRRTKPQPLPAETMPTGPKSRAELHRVSPSSPNHYHLCFKPTDRFLECSALAEPSECYLDHCRCIKQNPPWSPFFKGGDTLFPSLEKRGQGRFH